MAGTRRTGATRPGTAGDLGHRVRRLTVRHRRALAAILLGIAILALVSSLQPPQPALVPIVVAAGDLPAGVPLSDADLRVTSVPEAYAGPAAVRDPATLLDRTLATPILAGEPVTATRLVSHGTDVGPGAGEVASPLRLADPGVAGLLTAGDVIDVLASDDAEGRAYVVARSVRVLTVPRSRPGESGGLLSSRTAADRDGSLILVAVTPAQAVQLAQAATTGPVTVALHRIS